MPHPTIRRACSASLALVALVAAPARAQTSTPVPPLTIVAGGGPVSSPAIGVRAATSAPVLPDSASRDHRRAMTGGWARTNEARVSSRRAVLVGALVGVAAGAALTFASSDCRSPESMCGLNLPVYAAGGALVGGAIGYVIAVARR